MRGMTSERRDDQGRETDGVAAAPRDHEDLTKAVAELGDTDEDRLEAVAERNASLDERLPGDENLPYTKGDGADAGGSPAQG